MDGMWNRYNLKSTRRIYTFGILKCSEKFKVLDLPQYISICSPFVALETSKRNSISCQVFWIMSRVTVSMADVILSCMCWISLIFSAYTMFLLYPHRKKSSGERSGLRGGQGICPPLPIQASGNLSFKTSATKQLKWGGAPSCIKNLTYSFLFEGFSFQTVETHTVIAVSNPVHIFRWPCNVRVIKSRRMRWAGHVARMGE